MGWCYGGTNHDGWIAVASGRPNGRSIHEYLSEGRITLTGKNEKGEQIERVAIFEAGQVADTWLKIEGKTVHHIAYGKFETKRSERGREITRFHKDGTARHGKARRREELFGSMGVCHSWYKHGALVRQTFIYDNHRTAYEYRKGQRNPVIVKDSKGEPLYEVTGRLLGPIRNCYEGSHSVFNGSMETWVGTAEPFEIKQNGKVFFSGLMKNNQRVGRWIIKGEVFYYEHGVEIPEKLYNTPADELDPLEILKIPNAQLRMALMQKITPDRIAEAGKVIHSDGDMRLYDIKGHDTRILRVKCPTTKSFYYLRVPKDAKKCEEARQWTFHVGDGFTKPIKFAIET